MAPATAKERTIEGTDYIHTLASYVRRHESALADFVRRKPAATAPSWATILTMGVVSTDVPVTPKTPFVLRFDPHHLYYLLLKFDEAAVGGIGALDCQIDGGPSRPMSINYSGLDLPSPGLLGKDSDARSFQSTFSAVSSFSLGSGWWGASTPVPDVTADVRYLYSSCTKLPAIRLSPFTFSSTSTPSSSSSSAALQKPVKDFEDCPPPNTAVPLYAFKNLQSLILEDLDPRGFLGWDVLSLQLRSLEVHRSGIEDVGELLCDAVVEDIARRKKGRGGVGEERRRRQGLSLAGSETSSLSPSTPPAVDPSQYPVPPPSAWSFLRHLSLSENSLTFVPASPLIHLSSLTSLDLSSNLLIAVPAGLSNLHSLRSLNLADNMIESLFGISKALGNVHVVNLSRNRIDNLSGLDRLFALERVDLRENRLTEALEISRLAQLPCLREIWIESNPFSKPAAEGGEEGYRIKCFEYFAKEGRGGEDVLLDGTSPGLTERRGLDAMREAKLSGKRRASVSGAGGASAAKRSEEATAGVAKVVGRRAVTTPQASRIAKPSTSAPSDANELSSSPTRAAGVGSLLVASPAQKNGKSKPRRRKPQRIVDLDGTSRFAPSSTAASSGGDHSGTEGDTSSPRLAPTRTPAKPSIYVSTNNAVDEDQEVLRHSRFPTSPSDSRSVSYGSTTKGGKVSRSDRVSASTIEPSSPGMGGPSATGEVPRHQNADAFRKRIEDLRAEVGESWLSVLSEREAMAETRKGKESGGSASGSGSEQKGAVKEIPSAAIKAETTAQPPDGEAESGVQVVKVVKGKGKKKKGGVGTGTQDL